METLPDHLYITVSNFLDNTEDTEGQYFGILWLLLNKQIAKIRHCRCFYLTYLRHLLAREPDLDRKLARIHDWDVTKLHTIISQIQTLLRVVVPNYSIFPYSKDNQAQYISWTSEMKKCPVEVNCYILKQTLLGSARCHLRTGTPTTKGYLSPVYMMPLEVDEMGRIIQTTSQTGYVALKWGAIEVILHRIDEVNVPSRYSLGEGLPPRLNLQCRKMIEQVIERINQPHNNLLGAISIL